jgi:Trk K+ transport system NAD-binding subunit
MHGSPPFSARDQPVFPEGETRVEAGDEVFLLAAAEHIRPVLRQLRRMVTPVQRIMIAGGGNIGLRVAKSLEKRYEIKLIEGRKDAQSSLPMSLIVHWYCSETRLTRSCLSRKTSPKWTCSSP